MPAPRSCADVEQVRKIDRRKNLALRAVAEEVYENLAAFVKYRRGLARS